MYTSAESVWAETNSNREDGGSPVAALQRRADKALRLARPVFYDPGTLKKPFRRDPMHQNADSRDESNPSRRRLLTAAAGLVGSVAASSP